MVIHLVFVHVPHCNKISIHTLYFLYTCRHAGTTVVLLTSILKKIHISTWNDIWTQGFCNKSVLNLPQIQRKIIPVLRHDAIKNVWGSGGIA